MVNADQRRHDPEPDQEEDHARQDRREVYEVGRNIEWLCDPQLARELIENVLKEGQCTS
ncbi:hypothetical protein [Catenulispora pinisilvae]|uniref:hypothetical protein n=1 Tax=Catenulispora pinisilvae TaxID=2705253 RepID=UPI0018916CBF|nr:hypothetical protein [Catenulispora pinisilvae]